jgi:hypothetical protein
MLAIVQVKPSKYSMEQSLFPPTAYSFPPYTAVPSSLRALFMLAAAFQITPSKYSTVFKFTELTPPTANSIPPYTIVLDLERAVLMLAAAFQLTPSKYSTVLNAGRLLSPLPPTAYSLSACVDTVGERVLLGLLGTVGERVFTEVFEK